LVATLESQGVLNNTYIVYKTDNGYGLGFRRMVAGKCVAYREATNLPLIMRGPGAPVGVVSRIPATHFDLAPTFLEIAGVAEKDLPPQLDGWSLLHQWHNPVGSSSASSGLSTQTRAVDTSTHSKEIINVEFWSHSVVEGTSAIADPISTYKSLPIVGEDFAYLYVRWCTNEIELYNTVVSFTPPNHAQLHIHRYQGYMNPVSDGR
jgi:N-acetylglucosamine-6-sulfatase